MQLFPWDSLRNIQKGLLETISCRAVYPDDGTVLVLVVSCVLCGELRLADATKPVDDEDFAPALLGRGRLEFLLDLVELFVASYKLPDNRDVLQAERYVELI